MKTLRILTAVIALLLAAPLAFADAPSSPPGPPEIPPNGMGRYIIVLRTPSADAETPAHIEAPDVRKFGGSVVNATSGQIVATLPYAAINGLRANKNVAYVQRVWMGESPDRWRAGLLAITTPPAPRMASKSEANLTWDTGTFQYDSSGNIRAIGGDAYAYDSAGRIIEAIVNGSVERYGYDSFGNLTYKGIVGQAQTAPAVDSTSNRLSGKPYDAAGNMTAKDGYRYVYDSTSMMVLNAKQAGLQRRMIYTADDERIAVQNAQELVRWRFRDIATPQVLREFSSDSGNTWTWVEDWVYADGKLAGGAREDYLGGKRHYHLDHLGTVRMITNDAKERYARNDLYPFGGEQTNTVQETTNFGLFRKTEPLKYTGHERDYLGDFNVDNTDYLDYMHARYYDPNMGRFLSVDPVLGAPADPQSWNRYAYVGNNPIGRSDPTGKIWNVTGEADAVRQLEEVANSGLYGQRLVVTDGSANLVSNGVVGPPTPQQQALGETLGAVINDSATTTTAVVSDHPGFFVGKSINRDNTIASPQTIDVGDMARIGSGAATTGVAILGHEVHEQYQMQTKGANYDTAHAAGIQKENAIAGTTRLDVNASSARSGNSITFTVRYQQNGGIIPFRIEASLANGMITRVEPR